MDMSEKLNLIIRNTEEIVTEDEMREKLENEGSFNFYYGTAPTGPVHIAYLIPVGKVADAIKAGGKGKILIADYHAFLDDRKSSWEELEIKSEYYRKSIELALGDLADKVEFVKGSDFQTQQKYVEDMFTLASITTSKRAERAASEVTRMNNPKVSELMYPIMQTLDVKYLDADVAIGGIDQRHIYMHSRETLEEVGWNKPICVFTPLITSLKGPGAKMSASIPGSHIKVHETDESLKKLVNSAHCPMKEVEGNSVTDIARYIIFPLVGKVEINRPEKFGGYVEYDNFDKLKEDYISGSLHPKDLKTGVYEGLKTLITPIREYFDNNPELKEKINGIYKEDIFK